MLCLSPDFNDSIMTARLSQVCAAIKEVAKRVIRKDTEELFSDMGKTWDYLLADPQLRWYAGSLPHRRAC